MAGAFRLRKAISPAIGGLRAASPDSERKSGGPSVVAEHFRGFERVVAEILADEGQLFQNVVCHRDDVAADRICLKNVQKLTRARPDELGVGRSCEASHFLGRQRHWVGAGIAMRPAKPET